MIAHKRFVNDMRNVRKTEPAREESGDGHLVGRIQDHRRCATRLESTAGQPQGRETIEIGCLEVETSNGRQVKLLGRCRHPLGQASA